MFVFAIIIVIVAFTGIILYGLHRKGDLSASMSLGNIRFTLEAKEKRDPSEGTRQ